VPGTRNTVLGHNPEAQRAIEAAISAAAQHSGIPAGQLGIERIEAREWSDSSLGCPQPGFFYAQVITPGYLILLAIAGSTKRLEYHTDMRGRAILCHEL
jgi:hypothetical protein